MSFYLFTCVFLTAINGKAIMREAVRNDMVPGEAWKSLSVAQQLEYLQVLNKS